MIGTVIINARAVKKLRSGYPWFFDNDITSRKFGISGLVAILDGKGKFLGQGFYSNDSKIKCRFLTNQKKEITQDFFVDRIRRANKRRLFLKDITNAYRVIFSESDFLPAVIVDRYNDIIAVQFNSEAAKGYKKIILDAIIGEFNPASVIEKGDETSILHGKKTVTEVFEGDQHFKVDVFNGQKTGAYLDYRAFRMNPLLQSRAKGGVGGFSILDLFCYQGWFACHAASQIDAVTSVDSSGDAVAAARINAELNNHKNINFVRADAFDFLSESQDKFDLVHLDPPPFAKEKSNLQPAIAGYKKLADAALRHLKDNGILFISSCSHHVTEGILEKTLDESLKKNNRKYNVIFRGIQDRDHPVLKGFPESLYLKAIAVKLI